MAQEYDKIIKENLKGLMIELIRKTTDIQPESYEILYPELQYTMDRTADFILRIRDRGESYILHIEFQSTNVRTMADRMMLYAGLINWNYRIPIKQIVFYIGDKKMTMKETLPMKDFDFKYNLVHLHKISYKKFIESDSPEAVLLSILCDFENTPAEEIVEQIFNKLRSIDKSQTEQLQHIRQLDMLSVLRNLQKTVLKFEKNMPITLDIRNDLRFQEGKVEGREEGREIGRIEGIDLNKEETAIKLIKAGCDNKLIEIVTLYSSDKINEIRKSLA
jgi:predicted transposase YdaD